jgi:hypothetical protein
MADAEGQLEPGFREPLLAGQPGVVDQQVQRQLAGVEGLGALAHAVQVAEVQRDEFGFRAVPPLRWAISSSTSAVLPASRQARNTW